MTRAEILKSKILIVDDGLENVRILQEVLKRKGFQNIDCETDPRNVLVREYANHYDLILLDLQMPFMDGFEVMELLKSNKNNDIAIIMLIANIDLETQYSALEKGAEDFITKPFDLQETVERICSVLETCYLNKAIALAEKNSFLERSFRKRTEELLETRLHAIQCLGKAAEYQNNETGMHVVRMSKISARIAKELGWNKEQCALILHASPMHDIGKISIPDHILLKEGELDIDEREIMESHTSIGAEILSTSDSELFNTAAEIAGTHHEKWDGSGYPEGLKGEEIPMMSRIVAVCDTFDALISKRSYKKVWSVEEGIDFIQGESGKHFDPRVVEAFNDCIEDILLICKNHSDETNEKGQKSDLPGIEAFELEKGWHEI